MWTCIAHMGYFVLCAVLLTFLRCPGFSRALLLVTVPLNAVAEVNQQPALDLASLSLLLLTASLGTNFTAAHEGGLQRPRANRHAGMFVLSAGHWFVNALRACIQIRGTPAAPLPLSPHTIVKPQEPESLCYSYPPSSTPQK